MYSINFFRYIKEDDVLSRKFKNNKTNTFVERFETKPGQQAQFDMKEKVKLLDKNGNQTVIYIPTLTLSWSRYNYRQVIFNPTTDNLLIFLAQSFESLGGVPKELVIDNLKAFVEKPRKSANYQALLNSKFEEFCMDYGIAPKLTSIHLSIPIIMTNYSDNPNLLLIVLPSSI